MKPPEPGRPLRFVSAASLFDGHDAAINMIRRLLQSGGAEVVHLGHNRSVADIVRAAIAEDADAIAVSSYQGGHNEYFRYMIDMLRELGAAHIRVVVGGGGTISPDEIAELEAYGVAKIYTPEDGRSLGLNGMIADVFARVGRRAKGDATTRMPNVHDHGAIAHAITLLEGGTGDDGRGDTGVDDLRRLLSAGIANPQRAPVVGLTGTGGAGKSSLTDELLQRVLRQFPERNVAVVAVDPTRRRSGGALLGDRIRMNSLSAPNVFMRSLATRRQHLATSAVLADVIALYRAVGFDLIVVETAGIGQSDTEIVDVADLSLYVMTAEYGAASQLEKIDMLDFADMIVLNKFEKRGAEDALRDVRKQWRRNHPDRMKLPDEELPVFPTIASRFNDPGVNRLFLSLCRALDEECGEAGRWTRREGAPLAVAPTEFVSRDPLVPSARSRYLAEIAARGREERSVAARRADAARRAHGLYLSLQALNDPALPEPLAPAAAADGGNPALDALRTAYNSALDDIGAEALAALRDVARARAGRDGARVFVHRAWPRGARRQLLRVAEPHADPQARRPQSQGLGRDPRFPAERKSSRNLSVHRWRVSLSARRRRPHAHVRRRRRAGAHQPPLPLSGRGPRGHAPVHGLRLHHAVRRRSGHAARHLRPHGKFRRFHRHAR